MGTSQDTQLSCQLEVVATGTRFTVSGAGEPQVNVQNPQKVQILTHKYSATRQGRHVVRAEYQNNVHGPVSRSELSKIPKD